MVRPNSNTRRKITCAALGCDSEGSSTTGTGAAETGALILTLRRGNPSSWGCSSENGLWEILPGGSAILHCTPFCARCAVSLCPRKAGMMGGEIAEAGPRRRRSNGLGFCHARTAARLRTVGDEPQDERADAPAWRAVWQRVIWQRVRGFSRRQRHRHRRRLSGRPWILSLVPRPGPRSRPRRNRGRRRRGPVESVPWARRGETRAAGL